MWDLEYKHFQDHFLFIVQGSLKNSSLNGNIQSTKQSIGLFSDNNIGRILVYSISLW